MKASIPSMSLTCTFIIAAACAPEVNTPSPQDAGLPDSGGLARGIVATYHAESTAAGIEMLQAGGNAFDAFVAATFVDYVVSAGTTSAAGPLGVLMYVAAEQQSHYLDGALNEVLDPDGRWTASSGNAGRAFCVPGAVAALTALSERYGSLPLEQVLAPAIETARDGFVIDYFYTGVLLQTEAVLTSSQYGRDTFFPGGVALLAGSLLRLPEMADFFTQVAQHGAGYMYEGTWAEQVVATVAAAGGKLSLEDLSSYRPMWQQPRETLYRGTQVLGPPGRNYGGLWAMVGLEVLEHTQVAPLGHYSENADALELLVRTARTLHEEPWFYSAADLDDEAFVAQHLSPLYTDSLWQRVQSQLQFTPEPPAGGHSFHIVVADQAGNVLTGTNTIEGLAYGAGLFVQGVPLNGAGKLTQYQTRPGERLVSPFSLHIMLKDGAVTAATGAFGASMIEVELEMLVDIIDYEMSGTQLAVAPRFGTYPYDWDTGQVDISRNWLSPLISAEIVDELDTRGLNFSQDPYGDLGFGVALTVDGVEPEAGALRTYNLPISIATYPEK